MVAADAELTSTYNPIITTSRVHVMNIAFAEDMNPTKIHNTSFGTV
jgi:hypothetical protein